MADKPTLNDFGSGAINTTPLNENFSDIEDAIEGCLGRGGTSESPNSMSGDLDMDMNRIKNLGAPGGANEAARLQDIIDAGDIDSGLASLRSDLGSTDNAKGASLIGLEDSSGDYTSSDVEGALGEVYTKTHLNAGQLDNRYYTESELDARISTETVAGFIEIATSTEALDETDNTVAITPHNHRDTHNCTGTAPIFAPRAWINFDGTGTPTIRGSGNISSITDNGTGLYTLNFTTAMPDTDYCVTGTANLEGVTAAGVYTVRTVSQATKLTTSVRIQVNSSSASANGYVDADDINVVIMR